MNKSEQFPAREDLGRRHESKEFPGSNDVSMSTVVGGVGLIVGRPGDNEMYGLFFENKGVLEEVAMISGSTSEAEQVYRTAKEILQSTAGPEAAKQEIRKFIADLHGGSQAS